MREEMEENWYVRVGLLSRFFRYNQPEWQKGYLK